MRVLLLFGGRSGEHEVSVRSARTVADALEVLGHAITAVGITRDGHWVRWHPHSADRVLDGGEGYLLAPDPHAAKDVDVVFPVFHGPFGEDGSLQGLFELADLPYVGAGVEGSAIGLNKWIHRKLFREAGLPVVETLAFSRAAWEGDRARWTAQIADELGFPCFVKPAHLGSSVGISKVAEAGQLDAAMERALHHDDLVLAEKAGGPRELEVGIIDGMPLMLSALGEVVPAGEFYDYDSKYLTGDTELRIPAEVPPAVEARVRDYATRAFGLARCEGLARVDFFWDPEADALLVNEINTLPGLTGASMFPKLWSAMGVAFTEVVQRLLDRAVERHELKAKLEAARTAAHDQEIGAAPL